MWGAVGSEKSIAMLNIVWHKIISQQFLRLFDVFDLIELRCIRITRGCFRR
jgi:hypothetical protein